MNEPIRTQWQIRCAFNGFLQTGVEARSYECPQGHKAATITRGYFFLTCRHWKKNSSTSATSILQMMKQNSLSLSAAKKLLRSCLPKPCTVCRKKSGNRTAVLFFDMSEREIAKFCNLSRTTVQSRRTSSMKLLKRYLEERAYDCTDW